MLPKDMCLVFNHIPKTAGTTIRELLTDAVGADHVMKVMWYKEDELVDAFNEMNAMDSAKKRDIRILYGHQPFAFFYRAISKPAIHFSVLRDPNDRFISHLFMEVKKFIPSQEKKVFYKYIERSIEFFLEHGRFTDVVGTFLNFQTKWLSNATFGLKYENDHAMLNAARINMRNSLIGIMEDFDGCADIIEKLFPHTVLSRELKKNVSEGRPDFSKIPSDLLSALTSFNRLDYALYEEAKAQAAAPQDNAVVYT